MTSHNCYTCKHRGNVPGSAHSECQVLGNGPHSVAAKMGLAMIVLQGAQLNGVHFNPHGVRNGWCTWPVDFDPCWIDRCDLYEAKE